MHIRRLSATSRGKPQASAHAAAEVGQKVMTITTDAVQRVLHYDQLPNWMKTDPYIKRGYRPQSNSFHDCFWSLFYSHNELVNIWSHLVPAFCHLALLLGLDVWVFHGDNNVSSADSAIFQLYIICTAGCDLLSAVYHGTNSHSEHVSRHFLKFVSVFLEHFPPE